MRHKSSQNLPSDTIQKLPPHHGEGKNRLRKALTGLRRKIVVLDDDPTGVQTMNGVYVYTRWDKEVLTEAFRAPERLFFLLTNSRGLSSSESRNLHIEVANNIAAAAAATGQDFLVLSRGDSTLRGHWPMETEILRTVLEDKTDKRFIGEVIYPFFPDGGRYTLDGIHYVLQGDQLVPVGTSEFARDRSFGYTSSSLSDWCEEKSFGLYQAKDCCHISLELLRAGDITGIRNKLASVKDFGKIIVDSADYEDTETFVTALCEELAAGREYLFRCAAALPKVIGGIEDIPYLAREDLVDRNNRHGGIVLVGSHVSRTSRQLAKLRTSTCPISFVEFNQHRVLEKNGLEEEALRVLENTEQLLSEGRSVVVYTRRERLDFPAEDGDLQLKLSTNISEALTGIIGKLKVRPSFIIAKGGITSSDVGVKALGVRKALVSGQIRPGIPVWRTGDESKFPGLSLVIFPGNVGAEDELKHVVEMLASGS